jgi:adenylate kinase
MDVVAEVLKGNPERGFVLDGFPRTEVQGRGLGAILTEVDEALDVVIDLAVPTDVVLHRLAGRRVCESCGATYHVDAPPTHPWVCDVCGGTVTQRADDTEEAIARRLDLYERETVPLTDFYRAKGLLVTIEGVGEPDDVFARLRAAVEGSGPFSSLAEAAG